MSFATGRDPWGVSTTTTVRYVTAAPDADDEQENQLDTFLELFGLRRARPHRRQADVTTRPDRPEPSRPAPAVTPRGSDFGHDDGVSEVSVHDAIGSLIGAADNLGWAAGHVDERALAPVTASVDRALDALGVTRFGELGDMFDPMLHDAADVLAEPGIAGGHLSRIWRPGYRQGTKLLRPALVSVAP